MSILMSIHAEHLANIYTGKKTVELRKNKPKIEHFCEYIYFYECGASGSRMITGRAKLADILYIPPHHEFSIEQSDAVTGVAEQACVPLHKLLDYTPGYGWELYRIEKFDNPVPLAAIGLTRPPQSWQYIWGDQTGIIRQHGWR